jgi:hypothetical protein
LRKPLADRIGGKREDDRRADASGARRLGRKRGRCDQDVDSKVRKLACEHWQAVELTVGVAGLHVEIPALDIAQVGEAADNRGIQVTVRRDGPDVEDADARDSGRLLQRAAIDPSIAASSRTARFRIGACQ